MKPWPSSPLLLVLLLWLLFATACGQSDDNHPPAAVAGADQQVKTGSLVTLDGSGSADRDGDLLTFEWRFVSVPQGSAAVLSDPAAVKPTFTADLDGTYVLSLTVHDGKGNYRSDSVSVTAETQNSAPTAYAGPDQHVATGSLVTLSGIGADADGDLLTFFWSFVSRPETSTAILSDPTVAKPTFTADLDGTYVLSLTVYDGALSSQSDFVTIVAETHNSTPTANAGPDQNVATGSLVTLSGSGADADGDLLAFFWSFVSRPETSTATLSDPTVAKPTFTADADGTYVLSLTVHDGLESSQSDAVTITAETHNSTPTANAGPDQNVATGSRVTLNGSGADADGDLLAFFWSFVSRPAGSAAILSDPTVAKPTFTADLDGSYVLSLTVHDGLESSQSDFVTIVAETHNSTPTANAGPDQNVATGSLVTLNGSGTDADGDPLTFFWSFVSKPETSAAVLSDPAVAKPTFSADLDGSYVLSLTVHDGKVGSQSDFVTITAGTRNSAPVAEAGADQKVTTGSLVTLNGSGTDADGDPLTFFWSFVSRPETSAAVLSDPTVAKPTFTADLDGTYVISLIVHDGTVSSQSDTVTITAASASPPPATDLVDYTLMQILDPDSVFTVSANRIDFVEARQRDPAYLYADYGAGYFQGSFVHEFECRLSSISTYSEFMLWMLTNKISDWNNLRYPPIAAGIGVGFYKGAHGITLFQEQSGSDGIRSHPPDIPIQVGVTYYCRISFDQTTRILRLQAFLDPQRTIPAPADPSRPLLSQTGENEQILSEIPSFRYLYGVSTYTNNADRPITGYVADLNLAASAP